MAYKKKPGRSSMSPRTGKTRKSDFPLTGFKAVLAVLTPVLALSWFVATNFVRTEELKEVEQKSIEYARELNKGTKEDISELKDQQKETAKEMRDYFIQQQILLERALNKKGE